MDRDRSTIACAVVGTDARELGDARLDQAPLHREIADARFEDLVGCDARFACAIEMQMCSAVNKLFGGGKGGDAAVLSHDRCGQARTTLRPSPTPAPPKTKT